MSQRSFPSGLTNPSGGGVAIVGLVLILSISAFTQTGTKKNKRPIPTAPTATASPTPVPSKPVYFYQFEKPEFSLSKISIAHDENGIGTITFHKKGLDEEFVRPLRLSDVTVEKLASFWEAVGYLESGENYQFEKDYSHLGTRKLSVIREGKEYSTEFNWTEHGQAKALSDEYQKIGYEYVWKFDIEVARKNQPLESPRIMKLLDIYISRNNISDPMDMVPYLNKLSVDERFPLITRNHAKRIIKSIEKKSKKNK